jgi:hypothetical protein
MKNKNPFEMLLDENNNENIVFTLEDGSKMEFEQVALINLNEENFALLHPLSKDFSDDDVIAFSISTNNNDFELLEVEDDELLDEIYNEYKKLLKKRK